MREMGRMGDGIIYGEVRGIEKVGDRRMRKMRGIVRGM